MMERTRLDWGGIDRDRLSAWRSELGWLVVPLAAATLIYVVYLITHPYPAFGAGLFLQIATEVERHGFRLPARIPYYTASGIPFAYPPLGFYLVAALHALTGVPLVAISRYLPGLVTIAYLVPFYFVARELLDSKPQATVATLLVAVSPPILEWHISAGGIVRAPAFFFTLCGIYAGLKLFRTRRRRWLLPALACFSLTVLTHPLYTAFFVLSYLLCYAFFDRSLVGLGHGLVVGVGGLLLTAPWWLQVVSMHGVGVFAAAAGTHSGLGRGLAVFIADLEGHSFDVIFGPWKLVMVAGGAYLLTQRRYFVTTWMAATGLVLVKPRFLFLVGALPISVLLFETVIPTLRREIRSLVNPQGAAVFSVVLVVTFGMGTGALYATSQVNSHAGSASLPQFVDQGDVAAMQWVRNNTAPGARFVVLGDTAEWFPFLTHRWLLVGPWGVEWKGHDRYRRQMARYRQLSTCWSAACLTSIFREQGLSPDYVYVPKHDYTVRGIRLSQSQTMQPSLNRSKRFTLAYQNRAVMIYRVDVTPGPAVKPSLRRQPTVRGPTGNRRLAAP